MSVLKKALSQKKSNPSSPSPSNTKTTSTFQHPSPDPPLDQGVSIAETVIPEPAYVKSAPMLNSIAYLGRVHWHDGVPVPVQQAVINKQVLADQLVTMLSLPYKGKAIANDLGQTEFIPDPTYEGLTNAQVMLAKLVEGASAGSLEHTRELLDRLLGKPKQHVESVNMQLTYEDYLDQLAKQEDVEEAIDVVAEKGAIEAVANLKQRRTDDMVENMANALVDSGGIV